MLLGWQRFWTFCSFRNTRLQVQILTSFSDFFILRLSAIAGSSLFPSADLLVTVSSFLPLSALVSAQSLHFTCWHLVDTVSNVRLSVLMIERLYWWISGLIRQLTSDELCSRTLLMNFLCTKLKNVSLLLILRYYLLWSIINFDVSFLLPYLVCNIFSSV